MSSSTPASGHYNELSFYSLQHPDTEYFIHQHVVDAFHAQTADRSTKPIALTFALVGLYLFLEKGYTGREVQMVHMKMAKNKKPWPQVQLPDERGTITVSNVMTAAPGPDRDAMIKVWCVSVWKAYSTSHEAIKILAQTYHL